MISDAQLLKYIISLLTEAQQNYKEEQLDKYMDTIYMLTVAKKNLERE